MNKQDKTVTISNHTYTIKELEDIKDYIKGIGTKKIKPRHNDLGLCSKLGTFMEGIGVAIYRYGYSNLAIEFVCALDKDWPKHSGSAAYPIPSTKKGTCPVRMYNNYKKWGTSKYAALRYEFCLYIAAKLNKLIKEAKNA